MSSVDAEERLTDLSELREGGREGDTIHTHARTGTHARSLQVRTSERERNINRPPQTGLGKEGRKEVRSHRARIA